MKDAIKLLHVTQIKNNQRLSNQRDPLAMMPNDLKELVESISLETEQDRRNANQKNRPHFVT
jgi:hypothetical protein